MQSLLSLLLFFHHYPLNQGLGTKPLGTTDINADPQKLEGWKLVCSCFLYTCYIQVVPLDDDDMFPWALLHMPESVHHIQTRNSLYFFCEQKLAIYWLPQNF